MIAEAMAETSVKGMAEAMTERDDRGGVAKEMTVMMAR
jgi:hypothetical protein